MNRRVATDRGDDLVERSHVGNRQIAIDAGDGRTQRGNDVLRRPSRVHHEVDGRRGSAAGWKVHRECRIGLEALLAHVADDADDLGRGVALSLPEQDRPANRIRARPEQIGHARADDRAPRLADHFVCRESAPRHERHGHRLEVVRADDPPRGPRHGRTRRVGPIGRGEPEAGAAAGERPAADARGGDHVGHRAHARQDVPGRLDNPSFRIRPGNADGREQPVIGAEAALDGEDLSQTAHEQAGADEQRDRERDFGTDEHAAQPRLVPVADRAALAVADGGQDVVHRRLQGRREAGGNADEHGQRARDREHPAVDRDLIETRHAARTQRLNHREQPGREHQPEDRGDRAQHERFGEPLAHQVAPAGAKRDAQRALAHARRRTREQQVRRVHARDDEQQTHGREQRPQRTAEIVARNPARAMDRA